jgi:hypothetical protein
MSRSRKHTPIYKFHNDRYFKRLSNRIIRHRDIPSGGAFKRVMCSYDICDYKQLLYPINPQYRYLYDADYIRKAVAK